MSEEIIRAKGILDGVQTIEEAVARAQEFADYLWRLSAHHKLSVSPVADDYMIIEEK
jgi:hypothetical protein